MNIIFKPECKTEIIEPTYDLPIIGEPISKTGASANNSNAYGVIVGIIGDGSSRRVRVMTKGYIDYDKVKENYMEYTDEAINALTGITLCSGGKLPTGVQPDWNQNDDTKLDYVKNRPFYEGVDGGGNEIVHKLDAKYLPDEVIDSIDNAQTTANKAQTTANKAQTTANSKMNATNPVGTGSFSMGRKANSVVGNKSHAEGNNTTASGDCSHAEGYNTTASGYGSHAEGNNTTASGYDAHAEGFRTTSSGDYSHAEGNNTTASSQYSHVQGKYNVVDSSSKYAHIVGNGEDVSTRSNAHTLDWNGVPWFQGRPQFGGSAQDEGSQTVMANGDKEIILTSSTTNSTKKFKITVDDSGALTATEVTE